MDTNARLVTLSSFGTAKALDANVISIARKVLVVTVRSYQRWHSHQGSGRGSERLLRSAGGLGGIGALVRWLAEPRKRAVMPAGATARLGAVCT